MQPLMLSLQNPFLQPRRSVRFGNLQQPQSAADSSDSTSKPSQDKVTLQAPKAPATQAAASASWMASIWAFLQQLYTYLTPWNWSYFNSGAKAASVKPGASGKAEPSAATPTDAAKSADGVKAVDSATEVTAPGKIKRDDGKPKPGFLKRAGNFMLGVALNSFHVGAALFILVGIPFLHAPVLIGLGSLIGVQLFQSWIDRNQGWLENKFPHFSVRNPEHMRQVNRGITRRLNKAMIAGRNVLKSIPLVKYLVPTYVKLAAGLRNTTRKTIDFGTKNLLTGTINASKIPDHVWKKSIWGQAFYFGKVILANTLQLITGPFGKIGEYVYKGGLIFFRLNDAANYVDAFTSTSKPGSPAAPAPKPVVSAPAQNP